MDFSSSLSEVDWSFSASLNFIYGQSFQQQSDLLRRKLFRFRLIARPAERSVFKTLVQQQKAVSLPQKSFHFAPVSSAEKVKAFVERVKHQLPLYHGGKTVDPFSHIGISSDEVNLTTVGKLT